MNNYQNITGVDNQTDESFLKDIENKLHKQISLIKISCGVDGRDSINDEINITLKPTDKNRINFLFTSTIAIEAINIECSERIVQKYKITSFQIGESDIDSIKSKQMAIPRNDNGNFKLKTGTLATNYNYQSFNHHIFIISIEFKKNPKDKVNLKFKFSMDKTITNREMIVDEKLFSHTTDMIVQSSIMEDKVDSFEYSLPIKINKANNQEQRYDELNKNKFNANNANCVSNQKQTPFVNTENASAFKNPFLFDKPNFEPSDDQLNKPVTNHNLSFEKTNVNEDFLVQKSNRKKYFNKIPKDGNTIDQKIGNVSQNPQINENSIGTKKREQELRDRLNKTMHNKEEEEWLKQLKKQMDSYFVPKWNTRLKKYTVDCIAPAKILDTSAQFHDEIMRNSAYDFTNLPYDEVERILPFEHHQFLCFEWSLCSHHVDKQDRWDAFYVIPNFGGNAIFATDDYKDNVGKKIQQVQNQIFFLYCQNFGQTFEKIYELNQNEFEGEDLNQLNLIQNNCLTFWEEVVKSDQEYILIIIDDVVKSGLKDFNAKMYNYQEDQIFAQQSNNQFDSKMKELASKFKEQEAKETFEIHFVDHIWHLENAKHLNMELIPNDFGCIGLLDQLIHDI